MFIVIAFSELNVPGWGTRSEYLRKKPGVNFSGQNSLINLTL